jgi:hypothetical protein
MRNRSMRVLALGVAVALLTSSCMLSRAVDRAFLGISTRKAANLDRRTTGIFLLPFSFALDVVTFPIQALLVVILGDGFPFNDAADTTSTIALQSDPRFQQLAPHRQAMALAELRALVDRGAVTTHTALGLGEDGHWAVVALSDDAREQLLSRR